MLEATGIPVVEAGDLPEHPFDMAASYSNYEAAKAMTHHLARLGYRSIALATLTANPRARERHRGFADALGELGLPFSPKAWSKSRAAFAAARKPWPTWPNACRRPMPCSAPATCWPSAPSWNATSAAGPCRGRLAIASFDDVEMMRYVSPPMTCLRLPRYEIGWSSAEMLVARMQNGDIATKQLNLGFEILQRASA